MFVAFPQTLSQQYVLLSPPQNTEATLYNSPINHQTSIKTPNSTEDDKSSKNSNFIHDNDKSSSQIFDKKIKKQLNHKKSKPCDATNLNKNYSKAILAYSIRSSHAIFKILGEKDGQEYLDLLQTIKSKLLNISNISLYTENQNFIRAFKILGLQFMKKLAVAYIYNSKIQYKSYHIKNVQQIISHLKKL